MTNRDSRANRTAFIITIFSIVLLIISSIFYLQNQIDPKELSVMEKRAQQLVIANFDTASYFKLASLSAAPDYSTDEFPEGIIPCDTDIFNSYAELKGFINKTYVPSQTALLLSIEVDGIKRYLEYNGKLCMASVEPVLTYDKDWSKFTLKLTSVKRKSADIQVTVHKKDNNETETLHLKMLLQDDQWRLAQLVY